MKKIEPKIGEEFKLHGKRYKCIQWTKNGTFACSMCAFAERAACKKFPCLAMLRKDKTSVIAVEVEDEN